jgi:hypothetical protein
MPKTSASTFSVQSRDGVPRKSFQFSASSRQMARPSVSTSEPSTLGTPRRAGGMPWLASIRVT